MIDLQDHRASPAGPYYVCNWRHAESPLVVLFGTTSVRSALFYYQAQVEQRLSDFPTMDVCGKPSAAVYSLGIFEKKKGIAATLWSHLGSQFGTSKHVIQLRLALIHAYPNYTDLFEI